jgi:hypothetical protein
MSDEMELSVKIIKECEDGSAIITVDMDATTKDFLIGEGILAVLKRGLATSESAVTDDMLKEDELIGEN